jgi:hypothetical protein
MKVVINYELVYIDCFMIYLVAMRQLQKFCSVLVCLFV